MKKLGDNEQLEIPTLGFFFANVANIWSFMQPKSNDQALYDHFLRDSFGLVLGGTVVESVKVVISTEPLYNRSLCTRRPFHS